MTRTEKGFQAVYCFDGRDDVDFSPSYPTRAEAQAWLDDELRRRRNPRDWGHVIDWEEQLKREAELLKKRGIV